MISLTTLLHSYESKEPVSLFRVLLLSKGLVPFMFFIPSQECQQIT